MFDFSKMPDFMHSVLSFGYTWMWGISIIGLLATKYSASWTCILLASASVFGLLTHFYRNWRTKLRRRHLKELTTLLNYSISARENGTVDGEFRIIDSNHKVISL